MENPMRLHVSKLLLFLSAELYIRATWKLYVYKETIKQRDS